LKAVSIPTGGSGLVINWISNNENKRQVRAAVSVLICIREVTSSDVGQVNGYLSRGVSWVSSVSQDFCNNTFK